MLKKIILFPLFLIALSTAFAVNHFSEKLSFQDFKQWIKDNHPVGFKPVDFDTEGAKGTKFFMYSASLAGKEGKLKIKIADIIDFNNLKHIKNMDKSDPFNIDGFRSVYMTSDSKFPYTMLYMKIPYAKATFMFMVMKYMSRNEMKKMAKSFKVDELFVRPAEE